MTHIRSMLLAVVVVAPMLGCLASAEAEPVAFAADAFEYWQPLLPSPTAATPLAAAEPEAAAAPALQRLPSRPTVLPLSAGALLFAEIAACRRGGSGVGTGLVNARAMWCIASALQAAATR